MTTLQTMKENILKAKLRLHLHINRKRVTKKPVVINFEVMKPRDTIGRCYSFNDTQTKQFCGFDIVFSSVWIRRCSDQVDAFKQLVLHELAHTDRRSHGHDVRFRKICRRIGCTRDFAQKYCYMEVR